VHFVKVPNLPQNGAIAIIDTRCSPYFDALKKLGVKVIANPACFGLYDAVCSHPDMIFHDLGEGYMVHAPDAAQEVLLQLEALGINLIRGSTVLTPKYPGNIGYNAARVGNHIFHNFKYTDSSLLKEIDKRGLHKIHVNQGYSKCSICIVDENAIITADPGIHRGAVDNGIASLYIAPQKNIALKGLDYGFIGGSTGKISQKRLCIFGNVRELSDWEKIVSFAEKRGVEVISLGKKPVEDFGSLMVISEY